MTIGIFINPGVVRRRRGQMRCRASTAASNTTPLSDRYARFLIEEILPEVGKNTT